MSAPAIGIDLGTTYSCVAVYRNGQAEVIANALGNRVTPSVVAFGSERLIGDAAKEKEALNPQNTIFDVKRLIGRRYDDPSVQRDKKIWPYEIVNENGMPKVRVTHKGEQRTFYPEEISAMVLDSMKITAEKYLSKPVLNAVVTVPAHFNDAQRQATKDAAKIAGLKVLRLINEPTAAALAYGHIDTQGDERQVLVFDLGGGTFDVSVLTIEEGIFEVRATDGDTHLGGTDFDRRLAEHLAAEFQRRHGVNVRDDRRAMCRLRTASERAKRTLSAASEATIEIVSLHAGIDFCTIVSRARFEDLCGDLFRSTLEPVRKALRDTKLKPVDVDEVVLVGGSTRIPAIKALLRQIFPDNKFSQTVNPDEAVAVGAAVQAAVLDGDRSKTVTDLVLVDVTPLSLGIEVIGCIQSVIIPRNTKIPSRRTERYTTTSDYQSVVDIEVLEGERAMVQDNHLLGNFKLTGIRKAPRGKAKIDVTIQVDADGILHVTAVDKDTRRQRNVTIKNHRGRLTPEQIKRLVQEAEIFKLEDEQKKGAAEAKYELEQTCYDVRKKADKDRNVSEFNRERIIDKCNETLHWLNVSNVNKEDYERKIREIQLLCNLCRLRT